jgi:hypothetical protein
MPDAMRDDEYEDEDEDEDEDDEGSPECPFCGSEETCPHLLLTVDKMRISAIVDAYFRLIADGISA